LHIFFSPFLCFRINNHFRVPWRRFENPAAGLIQNFQTSFYNCISPILQWGSRKTSGFGRLPSQAQNPGL
jgi:hypothetical protein